MAYFFKIDIDIRQNEGIICKFGPLDLNVDVARTTVQGIYAEARKKIAESLVNGKVLLIEGGEYRLCEGFGKGCGRGCRLI